MTGPVYMLDTNIISEALRNPFGRLKDHVARFDDGLISTSAIVASEMRYGAGKKGSARLIERVEAILNRIEVLPYDDKASRHFGEIRAELERRGQPIGWGDFFIAAHARSLDLTLITNNVREFSRVPGLNVENWLEPENADVE
ncbi:MAG: Ribonuclease VapC2 [Rhizobium sp.]|nr:Ribonuclease VapC2 [Rhizobium sp.]